jgi:hypothetical protein
LLLHCGGDFVRVRDLVVDDLRGEVVAKPPQRLHCGAVVAAPLPDGGGARWCRAAVWRVQAEVLRPGEERGVLHPVEQLLHKCVVLLAEQVVVEEDELVDRGAGDLRRDERGLVRAEK